MRLLKFIQVNIYKGKYLDELLEFLKREDADIIAMQEVTIGGFNFYYKDKNANLFEILKKEIGVHAIYHGDLKLKGHPGSFLGNAVFSKFKIVDHQVVVLKKFKPVTLDELDGKGANIIRRQIDRHLLDATLDVDGRTIHAISVHGAWTAPPIDTEENLRQARLIVNHLNSLGNRPFIIGGDLNMPPNTHVIEMISKVARNLMLDSGVVGTLNPRVHEIAPRNFMVDYIFVSNHFKVKFLKVPEVDVSDHLPVVAQLKF